MMDKSKIKIDYINWNATKMSDGQSNLSMIDSSRLPLNNDVDKYDLLERKIRKEFKDLSKITNLSKVIMIIYFGLFCDLLIVLFYSYLFMDSVFNIENLEFAVIYLVKYSASIFNAVLYLKIIIVYRD